MGEPLVPFAADEIAASMLGDDARRLEAPFPMGCHRRLELVRPAERGQRDRGHATSFAS
jgi:hypothetical protein